MRCRFTQEELLAIDLEGRCVITDHGAFILFNLYGPAITSEESAEERFAYKMRLYQVHLVYWASGTLHEDSKTLRRSSTLSILSHASLMPSWVLYLLSIK